MLHTTQLSTLYEQKSALPKEQSYLKWYILILTIYTIIFTYWQKVPVPLDVHVAAILIAATCGIPLLLWYKQRSESLPIFELICISYILQYSIPVYTQPNWIILRSQILPFTWASVLTTLIYVELGVLALMVGFYVSYYNLALFKLPTLDLPLNPKVRGIYITGALILGSLATLLHSEGGLQNVGITAIAVLIMRQMNVVVVLLTSEILQKNKQEIKLKFLLYGTLLFSFVIGLTTGMLENALVSIVIFLIVRWQVTKKLPWATILGGFFLLILLTSLKHEYRSRVWFGDEGNAFQQRISLWVNLVTEKINTVFDPQEQSQNIEDFFRTLARFDQIHKFVYLTETTPSIIPYLHGKTYDYFIYAWIPRVLWPGKPAATETIDKIEVAYRFKYQGQPVAVGVGQLPDAYINFGILGIVLIMALQGMVFAFLGYILNGSTSEGGRAIYLTQMVYFLNGIGAWTAVHFGGLLQNIVVNVILLRFFSLRF